MTTLIGPDGPWDLSGNEAERRVVRAIAQIPGAWLVIPNRQGRDGSRDWEIDVVLLHQEYGVLIVEVKACVPQIIKGVWRCKCVAHDESPESQARGNAYRLRDRLREADIGFRGREVEYAVFFPNAKAVDGISTTGLVPQQVLTGPDLDALDHALDALVTWSKKSGRLDDLLINRIVGVLAPTSNFVWDRESLAVRAREDMRDIADHQVDAMRSLRSNRRVAVSGAAGTGKTRLAVKWARDAIRDDEESRVLITCYNRPLADVVGEELAIFDNIRVEPVLELFESLLADSGYEVPSEDVDFTTRYNKLLPEALHERFQYIDERFDVIIIDEAQDFSPAWLGLLESLLDPDGSRSLLMLFDESQQISPRGFQPPMPEDGWVVAEMTRNCRNADEIARLLYRRFKAAPMVSSTPAALSCEFWECSPDQLADQVKSLLVRLEREGRQRRNVVVQTFESGIRDNLRKSLGLRRWEDWVEDRDGPGVLCENAHRVKGLEFDTAIVVCGDRPFTDELVYTAVSRAVSELTVIGPAELGEYLGMVSTTR